MCVNVGEFESCRAVVSGVLPRSSIPLEQRGEPLIRVGDLVNQASSIVDFELGATFTRPSKAFCQDPNMNSTVGIKSVGLSGDHQILSKKNVSITGLENLEGQIPSLSLAVLDAQPALHAVIMPEPTWLRFDGPTSQDCNLALAPFNLMRLELRG